MAFHLRHDSKRRGVAVLGWTPAGRAGRYTPRHSSSAGTLAGGVFAGFTGRILLGLVMGVVLAHRGVGAGRPAGAST
ncbi:MAG TPA: hypothetical protein VK816_06350 [Jatrophihabitantaceae bacterium]|jgi:hypothetical protein|nr:hypothetical protein [Jatrophihabitantaceae bacterium]